LTKELNINKSNTKYLIIRILIAVLLTGLLFFSHSETHLKRNQYNKLPIGKLTLIQADTFEDENNVIWILQPHSKNIFHQPDDKYDVPKVPYSIINHPPKLDLNSPFLKLLHKKEDGSSWEAILKPNSEYVTKGDLKGTYNYSTPDGVWGITKHAILDVIPHFVCSNYTD